VLGHVAYSRGRYTEAASLLRPSVSRGGRIRPGLAGALVWVAARRAAGHTPAAVRADLERLPGLGEGGPGDVLALVAASAAGDRDALVAGLHRWRSRHSGAVPPQGWAAEAVVLSIEAEYLMAVGRPLGAAPPLRAALERAEAERGASTTPYLQAFGATRLVLTDLAAGEWDTAEDDLQRFLISSSAGLVTDGAAAQTVRGLALVRQGRFRAAWDALVPALDALHSSDPEHMLPLAAAVAAYAGARAGETGAARSHLAQAEDPPDPVVALLRPLAALFAAAARGALDAAAGSAASSPGDGRGSGDGGGLGAAADGAGDRLDLALQGELLCFEAGRRDRLGRLLEVARATEGRWAEAAALLASAFAARSPAGLLQAGERLRATGWTAYARDCFAEASRGFDRALRRAEARAAWANKAECDALLGDGAARPTAETARLTAREREVVAFALAGLSDREIAERLTVSVRTIEGHLYRAYAKLEVTSREQLGSALGAGSGPSAPSAGSEYTPPGSK
jgi:DNA-binding CsgD family transcriptional regulator